MKKTYIIPYVEIVNLSHPLMTTALSGGTGDNPTEAQSQKFWGGSVFDDDEDIDAEDNAVF